MHYANFHLHSTYSDAGFTPRQLVLIGKSLGYKALALTDHETDGGNAVFSRICAREGLDCITGVEFYGKIEGLSAHVRRDSERVSAHQFPLCLAPPRRMRQKEKSWLPAA